LEKLVKVAKVKHTDSTSWRVNGKNYFAWVFVATSVVLYKIRKRNNAKVPLTVFERKQKGMIYQTVNETWNLSRFAEYSTTTKVIDCFESYPIACGDWV
jgi:hypothetical protein